MVERREDTNNSYIVPITEDGKDVVGVVCTVRPKTHNAHRVVLCLMACGAAHIMGDALSTSHVHTWFAACVP